MKTAYFTPSNCGFIAAEFRNDGTHSEWPVDAVLLTDDETQTYWGQPAPAGKMLGAIDGRPAWVDFPVEMQVANADSKKRALLQNATSEIAWRQDAVDTGIATDDDAALLLKWKKYRVLLMRVNTTTAPDIEWPTQPEEQAS